jgi:hypothetical protein
MRAQSSYDPTLQMFVEDGREPDLRHLRFLRWLAERGQLEHEIAGPPSGDQLAEPTLISTLFSAADLMPAT